MRRGREYAHLPTDRVPLPQRSSPGTIGTPAEAKNSIAVGATTNDVATPELAFFSSRGPTFDLRTYPVCMFCLGGARSRPSVDSHPSQIKS